MAGSEIQELKVALKEGINIPNIPMVLLDVREVFNTDSLSSQVYFICIVLFTIHTVSKQLYGKHRFNAPSQQAKGDCVKNKKIKDV